MNIGYACLTLGVPNSNFKTTILKNASNENLLAIIKHNLISLSNIIDYNIKNDIKLFRISSDIIPFGSSPINKLAWQEIFQEELSIIGNKIKQSNMRVSVHPGQYTVLNSPKEDVVYRAVKDLEYHNLLLDSLNVDSSNKIILHVGGIYNDKISAIKRFIEVYNNLDPKIKNRLVIENDDKSYNIEDVLYISSVTGVPVVFDNLHNNVLKANIIKEDVYWIKKAAKTWRKKDGTQKIHYSEQDPSKRTGAHSFTINIKQFKDYIKSFDFDLDVMLEVKDKNLSAIKCINTFYKDKPKFLEEEWSKYKYSVLEKSNNNYNKIRELLKSKDTYPAIEFYTLVEESIYIKEDVGSAINAFSHVWGYLKENAREAEKKRFEKLILDYKDGKVKIHIVKNFLFRAALAQNIKYLLDSYYFSI